MSKLLFSILFLGLFCHVEDVAMAAPKQKVAEIESADKVNAYRSIAFELLQKCEGAAKSIAVTGFSYTDGRDSMDGGVLSERITTELVKANKVKVIERKQTEKVLEELKFQRSGAIDTDSVKAIGKMLGADWLVLGTLTELPNKELELNTRVVGVESGEIVSASAARLKKDWIDQYKKLLEERNKTAQKDTKDAKQYYERGVMYSDSQEFDSAIASFGLAIDISPTDRKAYMARGHAYERKQDHGKAIEDYSKAISIDPKSSDGYLSRGFIYEKLEEYDKATADFEKGVSLDPQQASVYSYLGRTHFSLEKYERAVFNYSKALTVTDKKVISDYSSKRGVDYYAGAYLGRCKSYAEMHESDKAIEDCSKAIAIAPKYGDAYAWRGYAYSWNHKFDEAMADFSKALAINPKSSDTYALRGGAYIFKEDYERAMSDYNTAISLNPENADAYLNRSTLYSSRRETEKAKADADMWRKLTGK